MMAREFARLAQQIAKTESVMKMALAVKGAIWDTLETRASKSANQLAMGRAMRTQLKRMTGIAQLAYLVSLAACARRSATLLAKLAHSMEAFSIRLGPTIALRVWSIHLPG